jgi:hypothetical protein
MRTDFGRRKISYNEFYFVISPIMKNDTKSWTAKIFNKQNKLVEEFFDPSRKTVKLKCFEWIKNKNHNQ